MNSTEPQTTSVWPAEHQPPRHPVSARLEAAHRRATATAAALAELAAGFDRLATATESAIARLSQEGGAAHG